MADVSVTIRDTITLASGGTVMVPVLIENNTNTEQSVTAAIETRDGDRLAQREFTVGPLAATTWEARMVVSNPKETDLIAYASSHGPDEHDPSHDAWPDWYDR